MTKQRLSGRAAKWSKPLMAAAVALSVLPAAVPAHAADAGDTVRVGLFLNLGSTYKQTTSAITLTPDTTTAVGQKTDSGYVKWLSIPAGGKAAFSLSGPGVKVMESSDLKTVSSLAAKLKATSDKPSVYKISRGGQDVYQVYTGPYASDKAASDAAARVAANASVKALIGSQTPAAAGSFHLSAGSYGTQSAASAALQKVLDAGLNGVVAMSNSASGKASYTVWVGEETSASALAALNAAASGKLSGIALSAAADSSASAVLRSDVSGDLTNGTASQLIQLKLGETDRIWVDGTAETGIRVEERSKRSYRGDLEIGVYGGQLYLVNELPMEQYLYSVVGSEVPASWPAESLKAQAVAARSYATVQTQSATKFKVADVVDSTLSQAYNGIGSESKTVNAAVDATTGEILEQGGKPVEALFSSNAGGVTSDPTEVWNSGGANLFSSVPSESDSAAAANLKKWYHVALANGKVGYVREDNVQDKGIGTSGLRTMTVTAKSTKVRPLPQIQSGVSELAQMNPGDEALVLEVVGESSTYEWIRGPYTSSQLLSSLKGKTTTALPSTIQTIQISQRGPSGRAIELKINGSKIDVKYPDMFRSALSGLPSTLFDVVSADAYTVITSATAAKSGAAQLKFGASTKTNALTSSLSSIGTGTSSVSSGTGFFFVGRGNGHGLGLSQWGAKGLADEGVGYEDILLHYYNNVELVKE
ncbi:SpoIID/LytB domain-containing protein [Saccharibacillus sp. CPCC 101409]|uniref:SpoIID/LytB domain-containing protein n=1 Tax=Saccharibacillus sp. CPCC 101409 TaxID=3058041 RepID=UPI0026713B69|nr:SpoIID/LytB domain-containing protein [Saccharibacillus sp. CPCC 101409]MDO3408998.1 SpoIID/LytB domain-containing protein [Saccharibacillus sp. CPCC 101409]